VNAVMSLQFHIRRGIYKPTETQVSILEGFCSIEVRYKDSGFRLFQQQDFMLLQSVFIRTTKLTLELHNVLSEDEFFPATAAQQRKHVDAVGCLF
jgi:hypothetical protein